MNPEVGKRASRVKRGKRGERGSCTELSEEQHYGRSLNGRAVEKLKGTNLNDKLDRLEEHPH